MSLRRLKPDPQGVLQALRGSGGRGASAPCSPAKSTHVSILEERCGAVVTRPSGGSTEQSGWRWRRGEDLPAGKRVEMAEGEGPSSWKSCPRVGRRPGHKRTWALRTASPSSWGLMSRHGGQTQWAERRLGEALCAQTPSFLVTLWFCTEHPCVPAVCAVTGPEPFL